MYQEDSLRTFPGMSRNALLAELGINATMMQVLSCADIVLLPLSGSEKSVFSADSIDLRNTIREALPDHRVEIAADDDTYRELGLHSSLLDLGQLLVTIALLPIIPNALWDVIKKFASLKLDSKVKIRLIVAPSDPDKPSVHIEYEGTAKDFPLAFSRHLTMRAQQSAALADLPPEPALDGAGSNE